MDESKLRLWMALSQVPSVGPTTFQKLLLIFGSVENVFSSSHQDKISAGCSEKLALQLASPPLDLIDQELKVIQKNHLHVLTIDDDSYPSDLKATSSAPVILYGQGNIAALTANTHSISALG